MSLPFVIGIAVMAMLVVAWMFVQNKKDRRGLEEKLNRDYPPPREDHEDADPEEPMK